MPDKQEVAVGHFISVHTYLCTEALINDWKLQCLIFVIVAMAMIMTVDQLETETLLLQESLKTEEDLLDYECEDESKYIVVISFWAFHLTICQKNFIVQSLDISLLQTAPGRA